MSFHLEIVEPLAQDLVAKLAPFCERIQIAGSIRRRRPQVNDVDLVLIPKLEKVRIGLFGPPQADEPLRESAFWRALSGAVQLAQSGGHKIVRGYAAATLGVSPAWKFPPVSVDVYFATPETWATLLLIRTGSAAHNIFLCARARELGGMLHADGSGLDLPNGGVYSEAEGRGNAVAQSRQRRTHPPDHPAHRSRDLRRAGVRLVFTSHWRRPPARAARM